MLTVIVFSALVASFILVVVTFLGKSWKWKCSFQIVGSWLWSRDAQSNDRRQGYQVFTSAEAVLESLQQIKPFPLSSNEGWSLTGCYGNCQSWQRILSSSSADYHVTGTSTRISTDASTCTSLLGHVSSLTDWDECTVTATSLHQSLPSVDNGPNWDIINHCKKRRPYLLRLREKLGPFFGLIDDKWCYQTSVYQRFWYREQDGSCWLFVYCVARTEWTFYLAQPIQDADDCILSVIEHQPVKSWYQPVTSWYQGSDHLTRKLQSFRNFTTTHTQVCATFQQITLPLMTEKHTTAMTANTTAMTANTADTAHNDYTADKSSNRKKQKAIESPSKDNSTKLDSAVDHDSPGVDVFENGIESVSNNDLSTGFVSSTNNTTTLTQSQTRVSPDNVGRVYNSAGSSSPVRPSMLRRISTPLATSSVSGESVNLKSLEEGGDWQTGRLSPSSRTSESPPKNRKLGRSATLTEDMLASSMDQRGNVNLKEWVETAAITHTSNYSTQSLGLSCDTQYRTCSNDCAAQILTELTNAANIDLNMRNEDQAKVTCGWVFSCMDKDVVVLKKVTKGASAVHSYIGKGLIKASPRCVWDAIRNPRTRFTYDDTMKTLEILHDFGNGLQVVHMHHEVSQLFKKESRDFCLLHGEKVNGDQYIITMSSIDWLPCPVRDNTVRGQFLSSGWVIEPAFKDGRVHSMVTYLCQMNVKTPSSSFVDEIASKQPQAISQLRQLLLPNARIRSNLNKQSASFSSSSSTLHDAHTATSSVIDNNTSSDRSS